MRPFLLAQALVLLPLAAAQAQMAGAGTLSGRVLDAATGEPVAQALVALEPAGDGLLAVPGAGAVTGARAIVTALDGAYRFSDVAPGRYRLRVERLGYRPSTIEVDLRRPAAAHMSVGLELAPVVLEPLEVVGRPASLFQRVTRAGALDEARIAAERHRQDLFLASDARMLTYADVMDGVTLGEGDVLRALQRFPGVSTRDDYTAELWTRGAPWSHTRVTFDGVPLFNPVHAIGVLSAFTPEVLGAVFFHPGVSPASLHGGAAGVVDLRTRSGNAEPPHAVLDLSLASSKLAVDGETSGGIAGVLAVRRSHLGVLTRGMGVAGFESLDLPFAFHDVAARVDVPLGERLHVEASGLWEEDRLHGDVDSVLERTDADWGNTGGRVTLRARAGGIELTQTIGASRYSANSDARTLRVQEPSRAWSEPSSRNRIEHAQLRGEITPAEQRPGWWAAGWDVIRESVRYDGPLPRYHAAEPDTSRRLDYERRHTIAAAWLQTRLTPGRLELSPALRLEAGDPLANTGAVRASPSVTARWRVSDDQTVSAAAGRSWQYVQALALAGPSIHPAFHASHFWLWSDAETPAIRSDVASLGGERWLGDGWLASATLFARRLSGIAVPDPTPGTLERRPLFVAGENAARGVDLGLRRLGTRWSASLGYSYAVSRIEAAGFRYPAPADRRHVIDALAATALPGGLRIGVAYTGMSAAPFTRSVSRTTGDCSTFGFGCGTTYALVEGPNAERTPEYRSLDLSLQWHRTLGRFGATAYLQVRNLMDRDNASTYAGSVVGGTEVTDEGTRFIFDDRFEPALPRMPLAGLRVTF